MFGKINVEKTKRSLEVRNEVIEMIREKFDMRFGYSFNDLYGVKGGVVRRLKGSIGRVDFGRMDIEEYNNKFNKVKEFVDNLDIEGFDIKLNKLVDYGWREYYIMKERGDFEGNFEDYKKWSIFNEGTLILKIKWDV
jgi:hypothetical protein